MSTAKAYLIARRDVAMVIFIAAIFILAVVYSVLSATTISTNISTTGTLTVDDNSTLKGAAYASSTFQVTGASIYYGNLAIGDATSSIGTAFSVHGNSSFKGPVTISSPLTLPLINATSTTGVSVFAGPISASSTALIGGNVGINVATSVATLGAAFTVHGNSNFEGPVTVNQPLTLPLLNATSTTGYSVFAGPISASSTALIGGNVGINVATSVATLGAAFTVHGNSNFEGPVTVNQPLTLPLINATSTTGYSVFAGPISASSTALIGGNVGINVATSVATLGAAFTVHGNSNFEGPVTFNVMPSMPFLSATSTTATSSLAYSLTTAAGMIGVASATPAATLGVAGNVALGDTATSTITLHSTGAAIGGCIEIEASTPASTWVRLYVGSGGGTLDVVGGAGSDAIGLVVEAGRCR